jgi:hypothetical protein
VTGLTIAPGGVFGRVRKRQAHQYVLGVPKSGPGQSRRFDLAPIISGLPREADYFSAGWHVSNVPRAEVTNPGNHRIKRGEQSGQSCPGNWLYAAIVELLKAEGRAPNFVPY